MLATGLAVVAGPEEVLPQEGSLRIGRTTIRVNLVLQVLDE